LFALHCKLQFHEQQCDPVGHGKKNLLAETVRCTFSFWKAFFDLSVWHTLDQNVSGLVGHLGHTVAFGARGPRRVGSHCLHHSAVGFVDTT
jgi:hypothetical protein